MLCKKSNLMQLYCLFSPSQCLISKASLLHAVHIESLSFLNGFSSFFMRNPYTVFYNDKTKIGFWSDL